MKDKDGLRDCFRLKEIRNKWEVNVICDFKLNFVLERKNIIKVIVGKIRIWIIF